MTDGYPVRGRLALVIGSGSVKCAAALGLWKVLQQEGIPVDMFVGCSGGSLFAASMALGHSVDECIDRTHRLWNRQITEKRHWPSILKALLPGLFKFDERFGMVSDAALLDRLEQVFAGGTFAETRTPLYIVATDFHTGEQVTLAEGSLLDALRASVAIPFIWSPWPVNGRLLIDGGLSDPLPVDVAIREGANIILAMGFENPQPRRVKSISRFAFHMSGIMSKNLFEANFAFHTLAHHAEIIPILPEFNREISLFDVDQIPAVIAAGERAAMEQIPYLRRLLAENWAGQYEPSRQMASQLR